MPRLSATSSAPASENSGDEAAAPAAAGGSSVDTTTTTTTSTSAPPPCPTGGPGGPRCCSRCSTSYARILFNKTKAAETAAIAEVGHEVAQLEEMLRDAQMRLRLAVDVSKENEARRGAV